MDELDTIASAVKTLVVEIAPNVTFEPKYGGEVFVPDAAHPKIFVGGVFVYKDHVSVEFSNGATLTDPGGSLEGKGKARRHVKLRVLADIEGKDLSGFLHQTLI